VHIDGWTHRHGSSRLRRSIVSDNNRHRDTTIICVAVSSIIRGSIISMFCHSRSWERRLSDSMISKRLSFLYSSYFASSSYNALRSFSTYCCHVRKNLILADCLCQQEICSTDYTQQNQNDGPVYRTANRHLQQAMVPGQHLVSVRLCDSTVYEQAIQLAAAAAAAASAEE
jgi:hypothetical protein